MNSNLLHLAQGEVIDPKRFTCLIPAAGRGTRLQFGRPKILYPINGRPILHHLIDRFHPYCAHFIIIASQEGHDEIAREFAKLKQSVSHEITIQAAPDGMADAIWQARDMVKSDFTAVLWGDQICLRDETVRHTLALHQSDSDNLFTMPTALKKNPYIHIQRSPSGGIERVLQAREGEISAAEGENDCGFFAFRTNTLFDVLDCLRDSEVARGAKTGEQNFLQLFPEFEKFNGKVNVLCIADEEETLGVNTAEEAKMAESILQRRADKNEKRKLRVVLFSGGRGAATLSDAFAQHPQIELFILLNAYDDGLSTGRLRCFIPGFLGPSDVRKNVSRLISSTETSDCALKYFLEYRLPDPTSYEDAVNLLSNIYQQESPLLPQDFWDKLGNISFRQSQYIDAQIKTFLAFCKNRAKDGIRFNFSDCSLGNLVLAGAFLHRNHNFNDAVSDFSAAMKPMARVVNITEGEPYVLVGLKSDGSILKSEAEVVSPQDAMIIDDIFLLENYLTPNEVDEVKTLNMEDKRTYLTQLSRTPQLSDEARSILEDADLIIYCPGTQHSSLFPSYLTAGLGEAIAKNKTCEKIFIANIHKDHEIQSETTNSLVEKFIRYMSRKGEIPIKASDIVTRFFFQKISSKLHEEADQKPYLEFHPEKFAFSTKNLLIVDWEHGSGIHSGNRVLDETISIVNEQAKVKLKVQPYMVSIIVPVLNEERTLERVLTDLNLLNFQPYGLAKEIIVVDGGSIDRSIEIAETNSHIRLLRMEDKARGRGSALRLGAKNAKGNIIAFFPSDNEYEPSDLLGLVDTCRQGESRAVFGSRSIKCLDIPGRIKEIYRGKTIPYLISKFGGMLLSILCLVLFNRFVTDPLTGVKVFDRRLWEELDLQSDGVELETEIIVRLAKHQTYILEMPVNYRPRLKTEGKKITVWDGVRSLLFLLKAQLFFK